MVLSLWTTKLLRWVVYFFLCTNLKYYNIIFEYSVQLFIFMAQQISKWTILLQSTEVIYICSQRVAVFDTQANQPIYSHSEFVCYSSVIWLSKMYFKSQQHRNNSFMESSFQSCKRLIKHVESKSINTVST